MKTDLAKILAVSGKHGLFRYIAQSRNGAIAEGLADSKRVNIDMHSRITTLADIAIYTSEGEMKLSDVFTAIDKVGVEGKEPKALFAEAVPNYDADRFYESHMKKIIEWYKELKQFASLDFLTDEEREKEEK